MSIFLCYLGYWRGAYYIFSRQKTAGGAYRSMGAKWGEYGKDNLASNKDNFFIKTYFVTHQ